MISASLQQRKPRTRRSMLFVPGANAAMVSNSFIYPTDALMFDLEDSVALREKDTARRMVYHALQHPLYRDIETIVRVNALDSEWGVNDLEAVVRVGADVVRLPKTDTAQDVLDIKHKVAQVIIKDNVIRYARNIAELTREENRFVLGASPRAVLALLKAAQAKAITQLQALYEKTCKDIGEEEAMIFEMHQQLLEDLDYVESIQGIIEGEGLNAEYAVFTTDHFSIYTLAEGEYVPEVLPPPTGDNIVNYVIMGIVSIMGLLGIGFYIKKNNLLSKFNIISYRKNSDKSVPLQHTNQKKQKLKKQ